MTGVVYAPSRREFAALRPSVDTGTLRRSGVGRRAALRTARASGAEPIVVAGVAGGLAPQLRTGDVVVATEVRGLGPRAECRSAPLLAAQLRRAGLTVHLGPVVSHPGVVYGATRASLAAGGALCVDMESAWLLAGAADGAVVRVVADPAGEPLLRPATVGRLRTALETLSRCGPVLERWTRTTDPRQVVLAEPRMVDGLRRLEVVDATCPLATKATDDICYATTNRQQAIRAVAEEVDVVLVVGSANSSHSLRLVETARRTGTPAYLIDDMSGIDLDWLSEATRIGLTAGASAPASLVDEVIEALRGLGPVEVDERVVATENLEFTLPKEVREA